MKQTQKNFNNYGFTLVELIVVITILAILGTIAFISLQGYSSQARDSKRLSDISNIKKSVELFSLNTGKYPKPDDSFTVSYSGETLRYQGTVGDQVAINLSRNLNEKPTDPSTGLEYTYSTTYSQTEYEVLGLYESDIISNLGTPLVGVLQSNAALLDYAKIDGNYNGIYIKTLSFYVPTPSIINSNIWGNIDFIDNGIFLTSQVITGGDNIPGLSTGGLDITLSVYTGSITEESSDIDKMELFEVIKTTYNGSLLANDTMYADILSKTSTGEMVDFVDMVVLNKLENNNIVLSNTGSSIEDCTFLGEILTASTKYEGCDTADIIICNGLGNGYVIAACNVGATIAGLDYTNSDIIGNYFQWGNNYAGEVGGPTTTTKVDATGYGPGNYYSTTSFIIGSSSYRYDWTTVKNNNLWGNTTNTNEARQGPCAIGYYIPTQTEWDDLKVIWGNDGITMQNILKLPFAGRRYRGTGGVKELGNEGNFWSSSPTGDDGYRLTIKSGSITSTSTSNRTGAQSIRCFKDN